MINDVALVSLTRLPLLVKAYEVRTSSGREGVQEAIVAAETGLRPYQAGDHESLLEQA